jgi:hypothetical protein
MQALMSVLDTVVDKFLASPEKERVYFYFRDDNNDDDGNSSLLFKKISKSCCSPEIKDFSSSMRPLHLSVKTLHNGASK